MRAFGLALVLLAGAGCLKSAVRPERPGFTLAHRVPVGRDTPDLEWRVWESEARCRLPDTPFDGHPEQTVVQVMKDGALWWEDAYLSECEMRQLTSVEPVTIDRRTLLRWTDRTVELRYGADRVDESAVEGREMSALWAVVDGDVVTVLELEAGDEVEADGEGVRVTSSSGELRRYRFEEGTLRPQEASPPR